MDVIGVYRCDTEGCPAAGERHVLEHHDEEGNVHVEAPLDCHCGVELERVDEISLEPSD